MRESQLQCIRELDEAEGLAQVRARPQDLSLVVGLVDAGADDRKTRIVALQPQCGSERFRVGWFDEDDLGVDYRAAVGERRVVTQPSYDGRIEPPNVFVGFDDQEMSHDHLFVERRMDSRVG